MEDNEENYDDVLKMLCNKIKLKFECKMGKPIIRNIFNLFVESIYVPDEFYKHNFEAKEKILNEMNLNLEQRKLLEQYDEYQMEIESNFIEKSFIYGMMIQRQLEKELKLDG